jgi:hypothetical protein
MIVYYDISTGFITGMSPSVIDSRNEPYANVNDSVAEQIFLGKEKISKYKVVLKNKETKQGFLVLKESISKQISSVKDRVYQIKYNDDAEIKVINDSKNKVLQIYIKPNAKSWWEDHPVNNLKSLYIVATKESDPSLPLWSIAIPSEKFINNFYNYQYSGTSSFSIYTDKFFNSYSYETKSS